MQRGDTWAPFRRLDKWEKPHGPFAWAQPSDKGRYLIGALRMFGGLQEAGVVLLHSYWRSIFEEIGGAIGTARRARIKDSIKKKVRSVTTPPGSWDDDIWSRMAALVASEAHQVRIPQQSLSYDELAKKHEPFLEKEREVLASQQAEEPEEWMRRPSARCAMVCKTAAPKKFCSKVINGVAMFALTRIGTILAPLSRN
jgi:hypothetical protein